MESLFNDIRYGIRSLIKRPGFTAVAVITLALGIGANTAIFTLLNAVIFGDQDDPERGEDLEIVGVVGDVRYDSAKQEAGRTAYRPIMQVQDSDTYNSNIEIRTTGEAANLTPTVRAVLKQIDANLPVYDVTTLREQLSGRLQQETLVAELASFFGLLALLLACIGLYGVMAHGVLRRTKEIGIRMAL